MKKSIVLCGIIYFLSSPIYCEEKKSNIGITFFSQTISWEMTLFQQDKMGIETKSVYTPGGKGFAIMNYGLKIDSANFSFTFNFSTPSLPAIEEQSVPTKSIRIEPLYYEKDFAIKPFYIFYQGFYLTQPLLSDFFMQEKKREDLKFQEIGITFEFGIKSLLSSFLEREIKDYFDLSRHYNYSYSIPVDTSSLPENATFLEIIGITGGMSLAYTSIRADYALRGSIYSDAEGVINTRLFHTEIFVSLFLPASNKEGNFFGNVGFTGSIGLAMGEVETNFRKKTVIGLSSKIPIYLMVGYRIAEYILIRSQVEYEATKLPLLDSRYLQNSNLKVSLYLSAQF